MHVLFVEDIVMSNLNGIHIVTISCNNQRNQMSSKVELVRARYSDHSARVSNNNLFLATTKDKTTAKYETVPSSETMVDRIFNPIHIRSKLKVQEVTMRRSVGHKSGPS